MTSTTATAPGPLLNVREVAAIYGCNWRTVYRLADGGQIPPGIKVGALRRWNAQEIHNHIATGCKPVRISKGGKR